MLESPLCHPFISGFVILPSALSASEYKKGEEESLYTLCTLLHKGGLRYDRCDTKFPQAYAMGIACTSISEALFFP